MYSGVVLLCVYFFLVCAVYDPKIINFNVKGHFSKEFLLVVRCMNFL